MTPVFPVIEIFDRLAVAQIRWEKTQANSIELAWYTNQVKESDLIQVNSLFEDLKNIHRNIWNLESELKSGCEAKLSYDELGRRAVKIRDLNNIRIALKNQIAETLNCPVREIKKNHLSE